MLLENSLAQYIANFKTALVFALLLVFVPFFTFFQNISVSSGEIFIDYNIFLANPGALLAAMGAIALYMVFYSFFVSIIVFSVRKNLSKVRLHYYLHEMLRRFTLRIFIFYVLFCLLLFLLAFTMLSLGAPLALASLLLLAISFVLLFVPQAVVVDEEGLRHALSTNFDFLFKHPGAFLTAAVVGSLLMALLQLLEFGLAQITLFAPYITLLLGLVFVLPFLEIMKTYLYMMRFELIKEHEAAQHKKPLHFNSEKELFG